MKDDAAIALAPQVTQSRGFVTQFPSSAGKIKKSIEEKITQIIS